MERPPRLLGIADVMVAAILFLTVATLVAKGGSAVTDQHRVSALRASQRVTGVIPALLVAFFVAGQRVNWTVLVIGLAWRGWLLFYSLPFLASALVDEKPPGVGQGDGAR